MEVIPYELWMLIASLPLWILIDRILARTRTVTWGARAYYFIFFVVFAVISKFLSGKTWLSEISTQSAGFSAALLLLLISPFAGKFFPVVKKSQP